MKGQRVATLSLSVVLVVSSLVILEQPATADAGPCNGNPFVKLAIACNFSATKWQRTYATWPSVPLNISPAAAANGEWIAEALWLYENFGGAGGETFLEVGDTAGGGRILGHPNEWARMWYWADATQGTPSIQHFIAYSPNDSMVRGYEISGTAERSGYSARTLVRLS